MQRGSRTVSAISETFWLLVLAVIVLFAFFLVLGTFTIGEVGWVAIAVGVLLVLYCLHALWLRRSADQRLRDPSLIHQRERRGF